MSEIDDLVSKIMNQIGNDETSPKNVASKSNLSSSTYQKLAASDYPLYTKHPELVHSPSGKGLNDINVDNLLSDKIASNDLRITPETLRLQGDVAIDSGRDAIQQNFERASELTAIPDDRLLEMYNALRPYRSTKQELLDIAAELKNKYNATICAGWFEEAADFYETRKKLKGDN